MQLKLTINVPDSATPRDARVMLLSAALAGHGVTITGPRGHTIDVDLVNVEDMEEAIQS